MKELGRNVNERTTLPEFLGERKPLTGKNSFFDFQLLLIRIRQGKILQERGKDGDSNEGSGAPTPLTKSKRMRESRHKKETRETTD